MKQADKQALEYTIYVCTQTYNEYRRLKPDVEITRHTVSHIIPLVTKLHKSITDNGFGEYLTYTPEIFETDMFISAFDICLILNSYLCCASLVREALEDKPSVNKMGFIVSNE